MLLLANDCVQRYSRLAILFQQINVFIFALQCCVAVCIALQCYCKLQSFAAVMLCSVVLQG